MLIDGLVYNSFGPDAPRDASSRLRWLRLQPGFHPQPYHQLASFLRDNGDEADSLKILAAKEEAESQLSGAHHRLLDRRASLHSPLQVTALLVLMLAGLAIAVRRYVFDSAPAETEPSVRFSVPQASAADLGGSDAPALPADAAAEGAESSTSDRPDDSASPPFIKENQAPPSPQAIFCREGEFWTITYDGRTIRLKDAKGLRYIAHLLSHPGEKFRVQDLIAIVEGRPSRTTRQSPAELETSGDLGGVGPILDDKAKASYRLRRQELREELDEAEAMNDSARAGRARAEMEMLEQQLSAAIGLGGRDRNTSSHAERARIVVTRNIRTILSKIQDEHAPLGRHLNASIKTGYLCTYLSVPESTVAWKL